MSPNKTFEGLLGGMVVAVLAVVLLFGMVPGVAPLDSFDHALWSASASPSPPRSATCASR